ncbi:DUF2169 family type VI secretion system accessory protein [Variovorax paradoxus]|jgi:uncharacterized protein YjbI with pentapeptide repeats|uniref:DUF2169 family type VI secretion system accessory protein n=1 Tax=Variovorax paradoxus TaxID=34073 RepID=UPI0029C6F697|nr:DUF2169 domain-containing protein [Variovorax paradoxus]WPH21115.1 DUF2169 domain-containing protein [Variovorax paradoxus]
MKVIKPMPLSLLTRCFEYRGKCWLGISTLLQVDLSPVPRVWPEKSLWQFWASQPEAEMPLDDAMVRARAEYLVVGGAFPHGTDGRSCIVAAQVGALRKTLLVHGDRCWDGDRPSTAAAFSRMPLRWSGAFGGPAFAANPLGKGAAPVETGGARLHLLPNIEYADNPIASRQQQVLPAGFGPLDQAWPQRASLRGTYGDEWLRNEYPAVASDTDWQFFNAAPHDQQQPDAFRGDEAYALRNMHPEHALIEGRLPGLKARNFVTHRVGGKEKFKEVQNRLNTLWFFPESEKAILVFQGLHEIFEDDGADIVHLLAGLEYLSAPREAEHYLAVRDKRLDMEDGAIESLREEDLLPADLAVSLFNVEPKPGRMLERGARGAREARVAAHELVKSHGLDPALHAPPIEAPPLPRIRTIDDLLRVRKEVLAQAAAMRTEAEAGKAASLAAVKRQFAQSGMAFSPIEAEMKGLAMRGPPRPYVDGLLAHMKQLIAQGERTPGAVDELKEMLADAGQVATWRAGERSQLVGYRMSAHYQPPADALDKDAAVALRRRVLEHHAQGGTFRDWDLTGADLSGMELEGADFRGALLERANLTGTRLGRADLSDAVLAHSTLLLTDLAGANLSRANLGACRIEKADFSDAELSDVVFSRARIDETSWRRARIDGVMLEEAAIGALDFSGAHAASVLLFRQRDLRQCSFAGVRFGQCVFLECDLSGVDFSNATIGKCAFVTVAAQRASFKGLRIESGCFVKGCVLTGADFSQAHLAAMNFRGVEASGTVFRGARLQGSDFSESDLSNADFRGADARQTRFVRARLNHANLGGANLVDAVFQHAHLDGTDYRRANLFQSDFARVRIGAGAEFGEAITARMRTYPRHARTVEQA